jgi:hypothetical protein
MNQSLRWDNEWEWMRMNKIFQKSDVFPGHSLRECFLRNPLGLGTVTLPAPNDSGAPRIRIHPRRTLNVVRTVHAFQWLCTVITSFLQSVSPTLSSLLAPHSCIFSRLITLSKAMHPGSAVSLDLTTHHLFNSTVKKLLNTISNPVFRLSPGSIPS